jgi:hypothetical protein
MGLTTRASAAGAELPMTYDLATDLQTTAVLPVRCKPWFGSLLGLPSSALLQPSLKRGGTLCRLLAQ